MLRKINEVLVKPIVFSNEKDTRPIKGASLFPEVYSNIFLCAKKKSGKSTIIYKIIAACCNRDTKVIAFVSTLQKDQSWIETQNYCKSKGIYFEGRTSLNEDKIDQLQQFITGEETINETDDLNENFKEKLLLESDDDEDKPKRKSKYLAPEYLIILDDLSTELKSTSLVSLLKKNRHFKAKIVISSQYLNDLLPQSRRQLDVFLVFKGFSDKKLKEVYTDADANIEFDKFKELYHKATEEPFSFFYIGNDEYRKNFNQKFII